MDPSEGMEEREDSEEREEREEREVRGDCCPSPSIVAIAFTPIAAFDCESMLDIAREEAKLRKAIGSIPEGIEEGTEEGMEEWREEGREEGTSEEPGSEREDTSSSWWRDVVEERVDRWGRREEEEEGGTKR